MLPTRTLALMLMGLAPACAHAPAVLHLDVGTDVLQRALAFTADGKLVGLGNDDAITTWNALTLRMEGRIELELDQEARFAQVDDVAPGPPPLLKAYANGLHIGLIDGRVVRWPWRGTSTTAVPGGDAEAIAVVVADKTVTIGSWVMTLPEAPARWLVDPRQRWLAWLGKPRHSFGCLQGDLHLTSLSDGHDVKVVGGFSVSAFAFDQNGARLAMASMSAVQIVEVEHLERPAVSNEASDRLYGLEVPADLPPIAFVSSGAYFVRRAPSDPLEVAYVAGDIDAQALSRDGRELGLIVSDDDVHELRRIDLASGVTTSFVSPAFEEATSLVLNGPRTFVASGDALVTVEIADARMSSLTVGKDLRILAASDAQLLVATRGGVALVTPASAQVEKLGPAERGTRGLYTPAGFVWTNAKQLLGRDGPIADGDFTSLAMSLDGVIATTRAGRLLRFELPTWIVRAEAQVGRTSILRALPDDGIATVGADRVLRTWDARTLEPRGAAALWTTVENQAQWAVTTPDGRTDCVLEACAHVVGAGTSDPRALAHLVGSRQRPDLEFAGWDVSSASTFTPDALAVSSDGATLATMNGSELTAWDTVSGTRRWSTNVPGWDDDEDNDFLAMSGSDFVTRSSAFDAYARPIENPLVKALARASLSYLRSTSNGRAVAGITLRLALDCRAPSSATEKTRRLCVHRSDAPGPTCFAVEHEPDADGPALALDAGGRLVGFGDHDGTLHVFDVESCAEVQRDRFHRAAILTLAIDGVARRVATDDGSTLVVRRIGGAAPEVRLSAEGLFERDGMIDALAFDPTGRWLIGTTFEADGIVRWDTAHDFAARRLAPGHHVEHIGFDPRGGKAFIVSSDRTTVVAAPRLPSVKVALLALDLESGAIEPAFGQGPLEVGSRGVAVAPSGMRLFFAVGRDVLAQDLTVDATPIPLEIPIGPGNADVDDVEAIDEERLAVAHDQFVDVIASRTGAVLSRLDLGSVAFFHRELAVRGDRAIASGLEKDAPALHVLDFAQGTVKRCALPDGVLHAAVLARDGRHAFVATEESYSLGDPAKPYVVTLVDTSDCARREVATVPAFYSLAPRLIAFGDGALLITDEDSAALDVSGQVVTRYPSVPEGDATELGPGRLLVANNGPMLVWDLMAGTLRRTPGGFVGVTYRPGTPFAIGNAGVLIDVASGKFVAVTRFFGEANAMVALPDGRYAATPGVVPYLRGRFTASRPPLDGLDADPYFNCPEAVLAAFGAPPERVAALAALRRRRLERLGMPDLPPREAFAHLTGPRPALTFAERPPTSTSAERITLSVRSAPDATVRVAVNGGAERVVAPGAVVVDLGGGSNHIVLRATTASGSISVLEARIERTGPVERRLWVLAIGVSTHRAGSALHDLTFADDDAEGVAKALAQRRGLALARSPVVLTNETATVPRIRAELEALKAARVDDIVVVSFAGHGFVEAKDYTFATWDYLPGQVSLPYAEVERALAEIPAQRKLLLIDACHAGERELDLRTAAVPPEVTVRPGARGFWTPGEDDTRRMLVEQYFLDPRGAGGTTIIGASGGSEVAFERNGHGLFTASFIDALQADGRITVGALRRRIVADVLRTSGGGQHPITRRQNFSVDFAFDADPLAPPPTADLGDRCTRQLAPPPPGAPPLDPNRPFFEHMLRCAGAEEWVIRDPLDRDRVASAFEAVLSVLRKQVPTAALTRTPCALTPTCSQGTITDPTTGLTLAEIWVEVVPGPPSDPVARIIACAAYDGTRDASARCRERLPWLVQQTKLRP